MSTATEKKETIIAIIRDTDNIDLLYRIAEMVNLEGLKRSIENEQKGLKGEIEE